MELPLALISLIIMFSLVKYLFSRGNNRSNADVEKKLYSYTAKQYLMTKAEGEFFRRLQEAEGDQYLIFPQVRLSSIIDHTIKGQSWKAALRHINQKSVDYVICHKNSLTIACAVELDDWSHERPDRVERDTEVERILKEAGLSLVRFNSDRASLSSEDLRQHLTMQTSLTNPRHQSN